MTPLLVGIALLSQSGGEYFPLAPGMRWEYEVTSSVGVLAVRQVNECLAETEIEGVKAIPMRAMVDGNVTQTTYFTVGEEFVQVVAVENTKLFGKPIPVLPRKPTPGARWSFQGGVPVLTELTPFSFNARVAGFEDLTVLGKRVRCARLVVESETGRDQATMKTVSEEWYALDIGLVKKVQTVKTRGGPTVMMELVAFSRG
ncbi:MAG: hypothetical protein C4341_03075 [Armatimonadota bacterium]